MHSLQVVPSSFEENLEKANFKNGAAYAQATAMAKAQEVASRDWPQQSFPSLVIGADTVVEQDGLILEKPADASDAYDMLSRFAMTCCGSTGGVCTVSFVSYNLPSSTSVVVSDLINSTI